MRLLGFNWSIFLALKSYTFNHIVLPILNIFSGFTLVFQSELAEIAKNYEMWLQNFVWLKLFSRFKCFWDNLRLFDTNFMIIRRHSGQFSQKTPYKLRQTWLNFGIQTLLCRGKKHFFILRNSAPIPCSGYIYIHQKLMQSTFKILY